jgi:hypothetical protein
LDDGIDCGFFVDPAEEAASEEGTVGVEVFGFDPFAGVEIHGGEGKKSLRVCGKGGGEANKVLKILRIDNFIFEYVKY